MPAPKHILLTETSISLYDSDGIVIYSTAVCGYQIIMSIQSEWWFNKLNISLEVNPWIGHAKPLPWMCYLISPNYNMKHKHYNNLQNWFNSLGSCHAYKHQGTGCHWFRYGLSLVWCQAITWMNSDICQLDSLEQIWRKFQSNINNFFEGNSLGNVQASIYHSNVNEQWSIVWPFKIRNTIYVATPLYSLFPPADFPQWVQW